MSKKLIAAWKPVRMNPKTKEYTATIYGRTFHLGTDKARAHAMAVDVYTGYLFGKMTKVVRAFQIVHERGPLRLSELNEQLRMECGSGVTATRLRDAGMIVTSGRSQITSGRLPIFVRVGLK